MIALSSASSFWRWRNAGRTYLAKPCIPMTIKGMGIMVTSSSRQLSAPRTRLTPMSINTLTAVSGMAWAMSRSK